MVGEHYLQNCLLMYLQFQLICLLKKVSYFNLYLVSLLFLSFVLSKKDLDFFD